MALYNEQTILVEIIVDGKGKQPLLQAVEEALLLAEKKKEELTGIAYSKGPGAFTGLRVGLATAKGIAYTLKLPIVGVGTLLAFSQRYQNTHALVAPLLDAKKGELYGVSFEEALKVANGVDMGLSASLITRDFKKAMVYAEKIECGVVKVNQISTGLALQAPFGGLKKSSTDGFKEQGAGAVEFYSRLKTVYLDYSA